MNTEEDHVAHLEQEKLWPKPRSPIPIQRRAKLLNALGIPTPVPALPSSPILSPASTPFSDSARRSPTPSVASAFSSSTSQATSRFLLHVIPPAHLPHDDPDSQEDLAPPPPQASGYHTQFKRGTLVPVHSTLQSQLGAIAREYALPGTAGMILYLVTTTDTDGEEPGPRISDDIWKHIWSKVVMAESQDNYRLHHTTYSDTNPRLLALKLGHPRPDVAGFMSPTTPSTASDLRSFTKSAPPSSSHSSTSPSEVETPATSLPSESSRANSIDLPGLRSPSLIPILAKVEFDIDRKKAPWYQPWIKNRKANHAKRTKSRLVARSASDSDAAPLQLKLPERMTSSPVSFLVSSSDGTKTDGSEYEPLADEEEDIEDETDTARVMSVKDPLGDVFGTDEEAWQELRRESLQPKLKNPHSQVVNLALTADELDSSPLELVDGELGPLDGEKEVEELLKRMSPPLPMPIPPSPPTSFSRHRSSTTESSSSSRKPAPPPLQLMPPVPVADDAGSNPSTAGLAYLKSPGLPVGTPEVEVGSPFEPRGPFSEKRDGVVYEDLDLGLDFSDDPIDENDPNDRRRSQILLKMKLDELEKNLVQFSPRVTTIPELEETQSHMLTKVPRPAVPLNAEVFPPTPMTATHQNDSGAAKAAWPAVPYSALDNTPAPSGPSPPRLAVNGITTAAPKAYMANKLDGSTGRSESAMRKRELEEEEASLRPPSKGDSPIIPLSPDPFGRYSSTSEDAQSARQSYWEGSTAVSDDGTVTLTSSRFSADSLYDEDRAVANNKGTGLMAMKSIKKLWRKSNKSSISSPPPPSERTSNDIPSRKTSHEQAPRKLSTAQGSMSASLLVPKASSRNDEYHQLQFDQESPYPVPRSSNSSRAASPAPNTAPLPSRDSFINDKDKSGRRSILKSWKSVTGLNTHGSKPSISENGSPRQRRPSVLGFGPRSSVVSPTDAVPPSPAVPEHFAHQPKKQLSTDSTHSATPSLTPS